MTPEGNTNIFHIKTDVLQKDPLAPFLFIICLNHTLNTSTLSADGLTLNRKGCHIVLPEFFVELAFADDITLMENTINKAESFHKIESAT